MLIAPTFLASIAGINTALPGQGSWSGSSSLVVLMALTAVITRYLLRRGAALPRAEREAFGTDQRLRVLPVRQVDDDRIAGEVPEHEQLDAVERARERVDALVVRRAAS